MSFLLCCALTIAQVPSAESPPVATAGPTPSAGAPTAPPSSSLVGEAKPPKPLAGWDNGFFLRSDDDKQQLRITGQVQTDYRTFLVPGDTTDFNTFLVRRARLGIEATVAQYYEFRLLPDFGQGGARVQDAYLNVHYHDQFQIEAGKFKQPFSYEQLIQDRFVPTMERSLIDQLVPARDVGVMIHGQKLLCDRVDYAIAVSDGVINGDLDTNPGKDVAGRVVWRPFNSENWGPWLRGLQAGMAMTTGIEGGAAPNPAILRTPASVPWFQYLATVREDGRRTRCGPEVAYFHGPLGMAAQYLYETDQFRLGIRPRVTVPINGFYGLVTLLLTGEERTTYSQPVTPTRPFDPSHPLCNPGAWELVFRMSRLVLDPAVVFAAGPDRLADPTLFSSGATELTLGFNWYLNRWVRTQLNWEHAWFDQPVRLGPGAAGLLGRQDTLFTRFQVIF